MSAVMVNVLGVITLFVICIAIFWVKRPGFISRHRAILISLAIGLLASIIGRGGIFQYGFGLSLTVLGIIVAMMLDIMGQILKYDWKKLAAEWVFISFAFQAVSLPSGLLIYKWDIYRAKNWCEQAYEIGLSRQIPEKLGRKPYAAQYYVDGDIRSCHVSDSMSFMGFWDYDPITSKWHYMD